MTDLKYILKYVVLLYLSECNLFFVFLFFLQQIMKDKWINIGYESDELKAHIEPVEDFNDTTRIGKTGSAS